ncbi:hypothetical protein BURPS1710b_2469 [Burkholderia pseudomallei 1710b]|uniref:Uncharacterized protein n=1 Tax=Burkholderia pseudomallei (strain 1710b) TaxID=320372 RepID=Q3JRD9_BURP1|nr:hypothetical protein BURPS1710b_2469 [Burkholderia pseudomallei 1710b]
MPGRPIPWGRRFDRGTHATRRNAAVRRKGRAAGPPLPTPSSPSSRAAGPTGRAGFQRPPPGAARLGAKPGSHARRNETAPHDGGAVFHRTGAPARRLRLPSVRAVLRAAGGRTVELDLRASAQRREIRLRLALRIHLRELLLSGRETLIVGGRRRDHRIHAEDRVAVVAEIHADIGGQRLRIDLVDRADGRGGQAVRLRARDLVGRGEARRRLRLTQFRELRLAGLLREARRLAGDDLRAHLILDRIERGHGRRLVIRHARGDQRIVADVDRLRVVAVLHRIGGEHGREELRVVERAVGRQRGVRLRRHRRGLDGQLVLVGGGLQALRLLVDGRREAFRVVGERLRRELLPQVRRDRILHFRERLHDGRLHVGRLQDMEAEIALHDTADFVLLQRERGVVERRAARRRAARDEAEVAPLRRRRRILRVLLGDLREPVRMRLHFGEQLLGLRPRGGLLGCARVLRRGDEDVAHAHLRVRAVMRDVVVVILLDVDVARLRRGGGCRLRVDEILDRCRLARRERLLVGIVVGGDLRVGRLHLRRIVGRLQHHRLHFALLLGEFGQTARDALRRERARYDAGRNLLQREVVTHALLVLIGRHALHREHLRIALGVERAVRLFQRRDHRIAQQRLAHRAIRRAQMQTLRLVGERALLNQPVEKLLTALRRVERFRVELRAQHLARLIDLLAQRAVEFGARDLVPVDGRDVRAFIEEPTETLNADDPKPRQHDQEQEEHHQALVIAKEIEHA